jgi:acetyl esterase/lipase
LVLRSAAVLVALIIVLFAASYFAERSFSSEFHTCVDKHQVSDQNAPAEDDVPDRSSADLHDRLVATLLRPTTRFVAGQVLSPRVPIPWQRWWLGRVMLLAPPARGTEFEEAIRDGVKGEWVRSVGAGTDDGRSAVILYLHGGGYCIGAPGTDRALTSRLARATGLPVFALDYRLAPEHPYPAAVDDAIAAYQSLMDIGPVVITGESAGAGLAMATALRARQMKLRPPAALILLSPWVDLSMATLSKSVTDDPVLRRDWLAACARHYLAGSDPRAPFASPIYGDLRGLPPTLIQVGGDELLRDDATRMHNALRNADVTVRCEVSEGLWHGFHLQAGMLKAANAAVERAGRFVTDHIAPERDASTGRNGTREW